MLRVARRGTENNAKADPSRNSSVGQWPGPLIPGRVAVGCGGVEHRDQGGASGVAKNPGVTDGNLGEAQALGGGSDPARGVRYWGARGGVPALRVGNLLQGRPAAGVPCPMVPPEVGPDVRALRAGPVFQGGAGAS